MAESRNGGHVYDKNRMATVPPYSVNNHGNRAAWFILRISDASCYILLELVSSRIIGNT